MPTTIFRFKRYEFQAYNWMYNKTGIWKRAKPEFGQKQTHFNLSPIFFILFFFLVDDEKKKICRCVSNFSPT